MALKAHPFYLQNKGFAYYAYVYRGYGLNQHHLFALLNSGCGILSAVYLF